MELQSTHQLPAVDGRIVPYLYLLLVVVLVGQAERFVGHGGAQLVYVPQEKSRYIYHKPSINLSEPIVTSYPN